MKSVMCGYVRTDDVLRPNVFDANPIKHYVDESSRRPVSDWVVTAAMIRWLEKHEKTNKSVAPVPGPSMVLTDMHNVTADNNNNTTSFITNTGTSDDKGATTGSNNNNNNSDGTRVSIPGSRKMATMLGKESREVRKQMLDMMQILVGPWNSTGGSVLGLHNIDVVDNSISTAQTLGETAIMYMATHVL